MRSENRHLYHHGIQPTWTPIKPVCVTFYVGRGKAVQIVRKQFPLRPSAGKTVHRSQGDTETEIVVDLNSRRAIPHIHYVALSRVTTIEGLRIRNLNEDKICVSDKVKDEMNRFRTVANLQPSLLFLSDIGNDYTKIVFLNARSLQSQFSRVEFPVFVFSKVTGEIFHISGVAAFPILSVLLELANKIPSTFLNKLLKFNFPTEKLDKIPCAYKSSER